MNDAIESGAFVTWKKACDCEGATATAGRVFVSEGMAAPLGGFLLAVTDYSAPVCDRCGTPWALKEIVP